ncbi:MAG: four helix bundle protein, partial [Bacteroidota bacterium]|nr:four helix bundle protein [Bacteroidota bacterium]
GANVEEAIGSYSGKEFHSKMSIAYKEARETKYWLRLLRDAGFIESRPAESLLLDCEEVLKILGKIISTTKKKTQ